MRRAQQTLFPPFLANGNNATIADYTGHANLAALIDDRGARTVTPTLRSLLKEDPLRPSFSGSAAAAPLNPAEE